MPSHSERFLLIISSFECEGLCFQSFTSAFITFTPAFHSGNSKMADVAIRMVHPEPQPQCEPSVNTLKSDPSHSNKLRIIRKRTECEGLNLFFKDKNTYYYCPVKLLLRK